MTKFKGSTYQVGDIVEITKESASTGMLDFVEGKAYRVEDVDYNAKVWCAHEMILLKDESGKKNWYNVGHFKLKENSVESNENHFKVGQTVWDVVYGKGEVVNVLQNVLKYPVVVKFVDGKRHFTEDGESDENHARTLFFSEPKIIAETKPTFVPTLQVGTPIILTKHDVTSQMIPAWVTKEAEDSVTVETTDSVNRVFYKKEWNVYSVGEKIEFN
jgi:hypothetical protein